MHLQSSARPVLLEYTGCHYGSCLDSDRIVIESRVSRALLTLADHCRSTIEKCICIASDSSTLRRIVIQCIMQMSVNEAWDCNLAIGVDYKLNIRKVDFTLLSDLSNLALSAYDGVRTLDDPLMEVTADNGRDILDYDIAIVRFLEVVLHSILLIFRL